MTIMTDIEKIDNFMAEEDATDMLSVIVNVFDEGIVIIDRDYNLVWANEAMKKWFNIRKSNIGSPCKNITEGNEDFCRGCTITNTFKDGRPHRSFDMATLMDKRKRTFQILTGPLFNSEGEVVKVFKIIRDVTDRERVVSVLAKTKERLEDANIQLSRRVDELAMLMELSDAMQAVESLDENLRIFLTAVTAYEGCRFNRAFLFLVNREENSIEGRYAVGPSSPEEAGRIWEELADNPTRSFTEALGVYRQAVDGSDIEVNTIIKDIKFDLSDESNLLVCVLKKRDTRIFNNAFSDPDTWDLGKTLRSDNFAVIPLYAMGNPVGVLIVDNVITLSDITEERLRLVRMLAGHASLAIERGILTDQVTKQFGELQKTYKKLRENQEILVRTEKLTTIGKLSAQMAHEIRNPLVSIGGFARNIAKHSEPDSKVRRGADIILDEVNRLEGIVYDVLSYSKTSQPRPKDTDLNELIKSTLEMIGDQLASDDVEVKTVLADNVGMIGLDPDQIRQVLLNLFKNAASAMVEGGVLEITTKRAGGFVWMNVIDTGSGIPGELKKKIFEPFFTTKSSGTGLGLSISYQIIEAHRGMIWFTSTPGKGTIFHVKLPVKIIT
jgi:signal transduction histidine kinase